MHITSIINHRKSSLGLTNAQIAERAGLQETCVDSVARGDCAPTGNVLLRLAKAVELEGRDVYSQYVSPREMLGLDVEYLRVAMGALARAREELRGMQVQQALMKAEGKEDTIMFDKIVENIITGHLDNFDDDNAIFTEESVCKRERRTSAKRICYFIDPFDRSKHFQKTLEKALAEGGGQRSIGDLMAGKSFAMRGVDAPTGSITCAREGRISFNAFLDYASGEMYVASGFKVAHGPVDVCGTPEDLQNYGEPTRFVARQGSNCVCYLGPQAPEGQEDNRSTSAKAKADEYCDAFRTLGFLDDQRPRPIYAEPGGAARILYLSDRAELGHSCKPAFILSNGEKIGEWLGWLAYAIYGKSDLVVFELSADKFPFRDGVLLAPPSNYSVFNTPQGLQPKMDFDRLGMFENPSFYRGAIAVAHRDSGVAYALAAKENARELIKLHSPNGSK